MERIAGDFEAGHLGVGDLDALLVDAGVERALDFEPGVGGRRADQFDHGAAVGQWTTAPVLRDVAEQPVFDPVPLRRARREAHFIEMAVKL